MNSKFDGTPEEFAAFIAEAREEFGTFTGAFKAGDAFEVTVDGAHDADVKRGDRGVVVSPAYADDEMTDAIAYVVMMESPQDLALELKGFLMGYHFHLGEKSMRKAEAV